MRWLVAGGSGLLGTDAVRMLRARGHSVFAPSRADLDITDPEMCVRAASAVDVVLNCAGWTAVDSAEEAEGLAFAANALGAAHLARGARAAGARIVHISTDYVFDGQAREPYPEDAPIAPRSAYGRTKAAGEWSVRAEQADHLIVRTAWLYGEHGRCFPKVIARRAADCQRLSVVDDQWGQPTWSSDVVDLLVRLVECRVPSGTYHATSSGSATWHAFAREVVSAVGHDPGQVDAVPSSDCPTRAVRPVYSVLGHGALDVTGLAPIGDWRERWRLAADRVVG